MSTNDCFDDMNHIFLSGAFVSKNKFCKLCKNNMVFNLGESLIGSHFFAGSTLELSLKLLDIVLFLISRYLIPEIPDDLQEGVDLNINQELYKEIYTHRDMIFGDFVEVLKIYKKLYSIESSFDINNSSTTEIYETIFNDIFYLYCKHLSIL